MLIGAGKQQHGLYFFRRMDVAAAMYISDHTSMELWHQLLGHPTSHALELLPISDLSNSKFDHKACEICIRAKQPRDSFPLSFNKTASVFELVHCDIWGPYRTPGMCGSNYFLIFWMISLVLFGST